MDTQCCSNDGKAQGAEGGNEVDETQGVQVGQLGEDQLQYAKINDELLQGLALATLRGISLCNCLQK